MANIKETAVTEVIVDGKSAAQELDMLEKKAEELWQQLAKAYTGGKDDSAIKKLRSELKANEKEMNAFKKASFDVDKVLKDLSGSSMNDLSKALKKLEYQKKSMNRTTAEEKKAFLDVSENIKKVKGELRNLNGELPNSAKNFASLDQAASNLPGVFGRAASGMSNLVTKVMSLGPIGALIGGGLLAIGAPLFSFFTSSEEGMEKLKAQVSGFKASISVLKGELISLGRTMVGESTDKALKWGKIMNFAINTTILGALKTIPGVNKYFKDLADRMDEASAAGHRLAKMQDELEDQERDLIVPRAEANKQIKAARLLYEDETKSLEVRMAALKNSLALEDQVLSDEIAFQQKKIKMIIAENALKAQNDQLTDEDKLRLEQEKARLLELETESMGRRLRNETTMARARREIMQKELDLALQEKRFQEAIKMIMDESQAKKQDELQTALDLLMPGKDELDALNAFAIEESRLFDEERERNKQAEEEKNKALEAEIKRNEQKVSMAQQLGEELGGMVADQILQGKLSLASFSKLVLLTGLKTVKGIMTQKIFEATVKSLTQGDSIATFGATGLARAAILTGLMETAYRVMEAKMQMAAGRYPVMGPQDGKVYHANYTGKPVTGIYDKPSVGLFSERMPEMVIDGPTTRNIQINRPDIINAIMSARVGQYAAGRYPEPGSAAAAPDTSGLAESINRLNSLLAGGIAARFSYDTVRDIRDRTNDINKFENRSAGR
jgi:hypothetical protein